jgi:hypothetical protein
LTKQSPGPSAKLATTRGTWETADYTGLAQASLYNPPSDGAEVFSLIRDSQLSPDDYLNTFFDTGSERQQRA